MRFWDSCAPNRGKSNSKGEKCGKLSRQSCFICVIAIFPQEIYDFAQNCLFFQRVPKGADSSALCFSVIETAKRNGLDSFAYLLYLFEELPKLGDQPTEEELQLLLPWANALPKYCRK